MGPVRGPWWARSSDDYDLSLGPPFTFDPTFRQCKVKPIMPDQRLIGFGDINRAYGTGSGLVRC